MDPCAALVEARRAYCATLVEASQPTDGRCIEAPSQQMVDATPLTATGYQSHNNDYLTFTPLMTGDTVTNITFPDADDNTPTDIVVSLWPETKAAWKGQDLLSQPWLLVDSKQHWFKQLCDRAEISVHESRRFATYLGNGWLSAMNGEGTRQVLDHHGSMTLPPKITIAVDGFRVTCLRYRNQFAFRLDTDALRFIPGYLYAQALKFKASPPKNMGWQKVVWNKHETKFDVYRSTGENLSSFSVNKSLPFEKFHAQQRSSLRMAVDLLNEADATNRKRKMGYSPRRQKAMAAQRLRG
jgi:hypothetical protein